MNRSLICALTLTLSTAILAQETDAAPQEGEMAPPEVEAAPQEGEGLTWEQAINQLPGLEGQVLVQGGKVEIDLPEGWRYFEQGEARLIVEDYWGNPPNAGTLGLVTPPGFEQDVEAAWAIIVSYDDEGHVEDDDAASIDYGEMLTSLQKETREANGERVAAGYDSITLVGWAEPPYYDSVAKKLHWAKHLQFGEEKWDTLNYDIRILGRRGTLVMQAVASIEQLEQVNAGCKLLLPRTHFVEGERYADYQEGVDPVVAGGIGALVAGKFLLKGGLLKLLAGLWKPIAIGFVVVGGFLAKTLGGRRKATAVSEPEA